MAQVETIIDRLSKKTLEINIKEKRYFIVGKLAYHFALAIHLVWVPLFFFLKATNLALVNILSVFAFLILIQINRKEKYLLATSIALIEVVLYQVAAVYYLGWDTGFQYFIIAAIMLPFFAAKPKPIIKFPLALMCMATFLLLEINFKGGASFYSIPPIAVSIFRYSNIICSLSLVIIVSYFFNATVDFAENHLEVLMQRSEDLLHNILPISIAKRLRSENQTIADGYSLVTVLFLDMVGFTEMASTKKPEEVVTLLNRLFSSFDDLSSKYDLEKIKTIGDSYMVAAGVPDYKEDDAKRMVNFALELKPTLEKFNLETGNNLKFRAGINSGPVVAGVIGKKKFIYDLWGDAVNVASRMESQGLVGKIQVSESTYELLKEDFHFEKRDKIEIKGKGLMQTYILIS